MDMYMLVKRVQKVTNKAIMDSLEKDHLLIRDDGVHSTKNEDVVLNCFMFAFNCMMAPFLEDVKMSTLEEVESWKSLLDPDDVSDAGVDHIKAGKALKYTISCMKKGKDPDPEKIFKLGGFMEEGSGNE